MTQQEKTPQPKHTNAEIIRKYRKHIINVIPDLVEITKHMVAKKETDAELKERKGRLIQRDITNFIRKFENNGFLFPETIDIESAPIDANKWNEFHTIKYLKNKEELIEFDKNINASDENGVDKTSKENVLDIKDWCEYGPILFERCARMILDMEQKKSS